MQIKTTKKEKKRKAIGNQEPTYNKRRILFNWNRGFMKSKIIELLWNMIWSKIHPKKATNKFHQDKEIEKKKEHTKNPVEKTEQKIIQKLRKKVELQG